MCSLEAGKMCSMDETVSKVDAGVETVSKVDAGVAVGTISTAAFLLGCGKGPGEVLQRNPQRASSLAELGVSVFSASSRRSVRVSVRVRVKRACPLFALRRWLRRRQLAMLTRAVRSRLPSPTTTTSITTARSVINCGSLASTGWIGGCGGGGAGDSCGGGC